MRRGVPLALMGLCPLTRSTVSVWTRDPTGFARCSLMGFLGGGSGMVTVSNPGKLGSVVDDKGCGQPLVVLVSGPSDLADVVCLAKGDPKLGVVVLALASLKPSVPGLEGGFYPSGDPPLGRSREGGDLHCVQVE